MSESNEERNCAGRAVLHLRGVEGCSPGAYVFTTERGGPLTGSTVRKIIARAGRVAKLGFPVHSHMLRHATDYYLANNREDTRSIQHYLGHKNISHTVRYTELAPDRFKKFCLD